MKLNGGHIQPVIVVECDPVFSCCGRNLCQVNSAAEERVIATSFCPLCRLFNYSAVQDRTRRVPSCIMIIGLHGGPSLSKQSVFTAFFLLLL